MAGKTILEWAKLFREEISQGASDSDIIQLIEDYKNEELIYQRSIKSFPSENEIYLQARIVEGFTGGEMPLEMADKNGKFYGFLSCAEWLSKILT